MDQGVNRCGMATIVPRRTRLRRGEDVAGLRPAAVWYYPRGMDVDHRQSDLQSLQLTRAAVDLLMQQPERRAAALATLDHWDRVAPVDSAPLRRVWRELLIRGDFAPALAQDDLGQQLRQASPLARVLPAADRLAIIRACKGRSSNT